MNRIIKFRAWDKGQMKMRDVHTLYLDVQIGMGPSDRAILVDLYEASRAYHVDRDVDLMQFTGLLDRNAKEIYEGDIVKGNNEWDTYGDKLQVVRYVDGTWNYSYALHEYAEHPEQDWEVVGNIYENPELLDEQTRTS